MKAFLTGVFSAAVLAALTLWIMDAGTLTQVEQLDERSVLVGEMAAGE